MATVTHKRGDTFELSCALDNEGNPVDLTNFTISAQIRDSRDEILQALTVTITDAAAGAFTLGATATETEGWGVDRYQCDIEFTGASGEVNSSETFLINVIKDITRG